MHQKEKWKKIYGPWDAIWTKERRKNKRHKTSKWSIFGGCIAINTYIFVWGFYPEKYFQIKVHFMSHSWFLSKEMSRAWKEKAADGGARALSPKIGAWPMHDTRAVTTNTAALQRAAAHSRKNESLCNKSFKAALHLFTSQVDFLGIEQHDIVKKNAPMFLPWRPKKFCLINFDFKDINYFCHEITGRHSSSSLLCWWRPQDCCKPFESLFADT